MVWAAASTGRAATWLLATLMQGETTSSGLDDAKTVAEIIGTLITALAVIVGAVWAYYRFVKGRTYRPRLEVSMGGEWLTVDGTRLLLARVRLRNIGASVVELLQKGTGLRVSALADSDSPGRLSWVPGRVYTIFEEHEWIEPGETVSDDMLLRLAVAEGQPVLFEARLVWKWSGGKRNIVVFARQVVPADATIDGSSSEPSTARLEIMLDDEGPLLGEAHAEEEPEQAYEEEIDSDAWQVAKARPVVQASEYPHDTERPVYGQAVGQAYEDPNETEDWQRAAEPPGESDESERDS
jgi:hypothetical protein